MIYNLRSLESLKFIIQVLLIRIRSQGAPTVWFRTSDAKNGGEAKHSNRYTSCYANLQLSRTIKTIVNLHSMTCCYAYIASPLPKSSMLFAWWLLNVDTQTQYTIGMLNSMANGQILYFLDEFFPNRSVQVNVDGIPLTVEPYVSGFIILYPH